MNKVLTTILFVSLGISTLAQYRTADVAVAFGAGVAPAVSYTQLYGKKKFKYGFGLRLTSATGGQTNFTTAPATLTTGKQSIAAFFASQQLVAQIDTLSLNKSQANSLNLSINLQYSFSPKIEAGFNIDALGLTVGREQSGTFVGKQTDAQGRTNHNKAVQASPTKLNLLLIGDSDIGSLNSELYGRYWFNETWGIRAGLGFQFVEYTATKKLAFNNDRFRSKTLQPMIAVSYKF